MFFIPPVPSKCLFFVNIVSCATFGVEKGSSNGLVGFHWVLCWSWFIHLEIQVVTLLKSSKELRKWSTEILVYRKDVRTRPGKKRWLDWQMQPPEASFHDLNCSQGCLHAEPGREGTMGEELEQNHGGGTGTEPWGRNKAKGLAKRILFGA